MNGEAGGIDSGFYPGALATRYGWLRVPDAEADTIGRFLCRYGEWAWLEAVFVASVIRDDSRIVDAGAFAGTFGLGVAQLRPLDFLCCVEANPSIAPLLKSNLKDNAPCPSVVVEALVAGPQVQAGTIHSPPGNLGATEFSAAADPASPGAIRAVTLSGLRAEYGAFDLIKLDIEGMELDALSADAEFFARGATALWIEANEKPQTLEVARVLLSWNLELFYFAFPSFNPKNFNGSNEPIFPFAYEAGLLAAPPTPPSLSPELLDAGCILKPVRDVDELKTALWRTPRWGMTEWEGAASTQELAALVGRSILGESFTDYLAPKSAASGRPRTTVWQQLEMVQTALHEARAQLQSTAALAMERLEQRDVEQARRKQIEETLQATAALAGERLKQLDVEQARRKQIEETLQATAALAGERQAQLEAEQLQRARSEEIRQRTAEALHSTQQDLQSAKRILSAIRDSTVWRLSAPFRALVARHPVLRAGLRGVRSRAGRIMRRWCRPRTGTGPPSANVAAVQIPAIAATAPSLQPMDADHRALAGQYFDADYYLARNPDVRAAGIDPLDHFLQTGWRESRAPNSGFDVAYYLAANQDVAAAGANPLLHYVWAGKAEGRLPRRPLDVARRHLEAAASPRERASDWAAVPDRSVPLSPEALMAALSGTADAAETVVAVSHDDYVENCGGVQNLIADEQHRFETHGWRYLHVCPAVPLPILADHGPAADYCLRLRLGGTAIGVARFPDLATALTTLRHRGTRLTFVFHQLLGHVPELLGTLATLSDRRPIAWVHDFFTICPSFALMRNDVKFCGAPPVGSAACSVCVFGAERQKHAARMRAFFEAIDPMTIALSAPALDLWQRRSGLPHAGGAFIHPARLVMSDDGGPAPGPSQTPLRIAHLGSTVMHKGWHVFEQLAFAHADDPRYAFYHLGLGSTASSRYVCDPVRVAPDRRNAMTEAVVRNQIDVVICWSLCRETFCFTVHEALAGGAFVVVRRDAGNAWPAVEANAAEQGCAVDDEAGLFQLFGSGAIQAIVARARRRLGVLYPSGSTAEYLLGEGAATAPDRHVQ